MYSDSRLMRGDLPPRTSELIFEMLKMLTCSARPSNSVAAALLIVVVAGDDLRRVGGELRDALEDVLRRVRREVGDQLVVDRQVRRQHEEVVDAVRQVQVADERAHQPRLAHAGGQRKAERRKVALEVGDAWELASDSRKGRDSIGVFDGAATSITRSRISSDLRWGGLRLSRLATAKTWRCIESPSPCFPCS